MARSKGTKRSEREAAESGGFPIWNELTVDDGAESCIMRGFAEILEVVVALLFSIRARSPWLTVREAERYAHAPHGAINKAIRAGELPAYQRRPGTIMLVDVDEVNRWIRDAWRIRYVDGEPRRAK